MHASIGRKENVKQYTSKNTCNGSGGPRTLPMGEGAEELIGDPTVKPHPRTLD